MPAIEKVTADADPLQAIKTEWIAQTVEEAPVEAA